MAIQTREQLATLLGQLPLSESQRNFMVGTAYIDQAGLRSLYIGFLLSRPDSGTVMQHFLSSGGYYAAGFGGDQNGEQVFFHYRPTGLPPPADPCEPMQWWWCRAPANWRPRINQPL